VSEHDSPGPDEKKNKGTRRSLSRCKDSIFFYVRDHLHRFTCTWLSSSVKAISVMSDGGCSAQMLSPSLSFPFRCSGLASGTRRERRLYALVGVVRIWHSRHFNHVDHFHCFTQKIHMTTVMREHILTCAHLYSFYVNSVQLRHLLFFISMSGFQNVFQMPVGLVKVSLLRLQLRQLFPKTQRTTSNCAKRTALTA